MSMAGFFEVMIERNFSSAHQLRGYKGKCENLPEGATLGAEWDVPPNMTLEDIEKMVIEKTLQRTGGNKQAAANLLGIYRPRLYSKIRKYRIDVPGLVAG